MTARTPVTSAAIATLLLPRRDMRSGQAHILLTVQWSRLAEFVGTAERRRLTLRVGQSTSVLSWSAQVRRLTATRISLVLSLPLHARRRTRST